jgi:hypothetical protein
MNIKCINFENSNELNFLMDRIQAFKASLLNHSPAKDLSPELTSLWYDGKGDWDQAHAQVDHLAGRDAAWVHAYLHRKEGDMWNADYWYARAKQMRPTCSLDEEWEQLIEALL